MDRPGITLRWVVELLHRLKVPHQAVGGLAARGYGARRPLADLDFYVPTDRLDEVARAAGCDVVRPPSRHRDECWDLVFMTIDHAGQDVELAGADGARFFDRTAGRWCDAEIDFGRSVETEIFGVRVPVMPFEQLVAYKRALDRDVDRQDVADMLAAHPERAGSHESDGQPRPAGGTVPDALGLESGVVRLVDYDDRWPALFAAEAQRIRDVCGLPTLTLEHVGGTSIAGMCSKPVVDIAAGRPRGAPLRDYVVALERAGYEHRGERGVPGREYFRRGDPRAYHLHLVDEGGPLWCDYLAFRDYLRAHPDAARRLAAEKQTLAARFARDREGYMTAKSPLVDELLQQARGSA